LNFGSGSSREQAATALKFKGIPCVIAASFSETYKRNAFNNGFVVFECPDLVSYLRENLKNRAPTTVGPEITIDYATSVLTLDGKSFTFPPLSPAAQELIVAGGAENLVASRLRAKPQKNVEIFIPVAAVYDPRILNSLGSGRRGDLAMHPRGRELWFLNRDMLARADDLQI